MGKLIMSLLREAERRSNPLNSTRHCEDEVRSNLSPVGSSNNEIASLPAVVRNDEINIDIGSLPAGIYFVKVTTNKGTAVRKFVKQ